MQIVDVAAASAEPITAYNSVGAASLPLGDGHGEAHIYCVRFAAGGAIGPHPTGFAQLFLVIAGAGWVSGANGVRVPIACGQAAYFARGELHSKGSDTGMTALMMQVYDLAPRAAVD